MRYALFGRSGLRVSEFFLGAMTFGEDGGVGASLEESRRILDRYLDQGGNVVDTASNYRGGASEEYLGTLLAGRRDRVVLASKYTVTRDPGDANAGGNARKNLRLTLEQSLRRLGTDHVDIYWVHLWDRSTPIEETMRALDDMVRAGKILYVGMSDTPAWVVSRATTLAELRDWSPLVGIQVPYSLVERRIERELLPMATHLGLGVAAWSPLGGGLLTGKYRTAETAGRLRGQQPSAQQRAVVDEVCAVADELGVTPAQVALAWARTAGGQGVHPIIGARTADQLQESLDALDIRLDQDVLVRLDRVSAIELGFPSEFIAETSRWVFGAALLPDAAATTPDTR